MNTHQLDSFIEKIIKSRIKVPHRKGPAPFLHFNVEEVNKILSAAEDVFKRDPILLRLPSDIVVVGDMHGNIDDLLRVFGRCGYPPETRYLFLGDYVDRGQNSLEVFLLLVAFKIRFPDRFFMLRGNHESESMTSVYGFRAEVRRRLNKNAFWNFVRVFRHLSIAAVIDNRVFCVHGGMSKDLHRLEQLQRLSKPDQVPSQGIIADLLWSDPVAEVQNFTVSDRNVGYLFGAKPLCKFLDQNGLEMLVRSHESCENGFNWPFEYCKDGQRRCLTVFSNTNYCDEGNDGAVLRIPAEGDYEILSFAAGKKGRFTLPSFLLQENIIEKPLIESIEDDRIPEIPNADLLPLAA